MIGIYLVTLGITTIVWLCDKHLEAKKAAGWDCKRVGESKFYCDACDIERQGGSANVT